MHKVPKIKGVLLPTVSFLHFFCKVPVYIFLNTDSLVRAFVPLKKMRNILARSELGPVIVWDSAVRCDISHNEFRFRNAVKLRKQSVCHTQVYHP